MSLALRSHLSLLPSSKTPANNNPAVFHSLPTSDSQKLPMAHPMGLKLTQESKSSLQSFGTNCLQMDTLPFLCTSQTYK